MIDDEACLRPLAHLPQRISTLTLFYNKPGQNLGRDTTTPQEETEHVHTLRS